MKKRVALFLAVFICLNIGVSTRASTVQSVKEVKPAEQVALRADIIIMKTRFYNGVLQYRRWNETKGYWVDPYWIDL